MFACLAKTGFTHCLGLREAHGVAQLIFFRLSTGGFHASISTAMALNERSRVTPRATRRASGAIPDVAKNVNEVLPESRAVCVPVSHVSACAPTAGRVPWRE